MESSIRSLTTVSSQLNLNVLLFAVPYLRFCMKYPCKGVAILKIY